MSLRMTETQFSELIKNSVHEGRYDIPTDDVEASNHTHNTKSKSPNKRTVKPTPNPEMEKLASNINKAIPWVLAIKVGMSTLPLIAVGLVMAGIATGLVFIVDLVTLFWNILRLLWLLVTLNGMIFSGEHWGMIWASMGDMTLFDKGWVFWAIMIGYAGLAGVGAWWVFKK